MKATVQLLRSYGRRLRRQELGTGPRLVGDLTMHTVNHRAYGSVAVLLLRDACNQTAEGQLAALYEPVITGLGNGIFRFRGIERVETNDGPVGYAQEWRCELLPDRVG